jgi:alpha-L-fucosidase
MTFAGRVYLGKDNRITTEAYPRVIDSNFNTYDSAAANLKLLQSFDSYEKLDEIKIKAVMDYFLYVSNRDEELFKIERYKEYVKNTRPDSLVIDCMELFEISRLEFEHWNIPWDISINPTKDMKELRRCHFSDENNV